MRKVLENESELHARIFRFPTSALKLNGQKINYYDFMLKADNSECKEALKRIAPEINLPDIEAFIDRVPCITELQKTFYKTYIKSRFQLIISPRI